MYRECRQLVLGWWSGQVISATFGEQRYRKDIASAAEFRHHIPLPISASLDIDDSSVVKSSPGHWTNKEKVCRQSGGTFFCQQTLCSVIFSDCREKGLEIKRREYSTV